MSPAQCGLQVVASNHQRTNENNALALSVTKELNQNNHSTQNKLFRSFELQRTTSLKKTPDDV
jgi:hypothetical protein